MNTDLATAAARSGFTCLHLESIGSTNDEALRHLRSGGAGDHWIVADRQEGGRGRLGRTWVSEPGNLYATLALRDPCPVEVAYQFGFVAALAIHTALRTLGVAGSRLALKWPNDALLDGAKVSGILIEGSRFEDGSFGVAVGCGINIAHHPADTPYAATDLRASGIDTTCSHAFDALAAAFRDHTDLFASGAGFHHIRARWLDHARGIGGPVVVRERTGSKMGLFAGLDPEGRLLLKADGIVTPVVAGDVFFD